MEIHARGRRQWRQPLNVYPAMPRCLWWKLSIALATRGRAPAADPPLKSFNLLGFSRFSGFGVGTQGLGLQMSQHGPT